MNYQHIVGAQSTITRELRQEIRQENIYKAIEGLVTDLHIRLLQIQLQLSEIFSLLSHAANDRMYEAVLDVTSITAKLTKIQENLPAGKAIPYLNSSEIITLFKIARLEYVKIDHGLYLELNFPIIYSKQMLSITSYIPVPTKIPNYSDEFMYTSAQYEQYLENTATQEYYGLHFAEFDHSCSKLLHRLYICDISSQLMWKTTENPTTMTN